MVIGIDSSALTLANPTGVQKYTEYIIRHLLDSKQDHMFKLYTPRSLPEPFNAHEVVITSPKFWTQMRLPIELFMHRPDVFFQPGYMLPPYTFTNNVVTIQDFGWLKYPNAYSQTQHQLQRIALKRIAQLHAKIIVPSISTQQDLLEYFPTLTNSVHVIYDALIELPKANTKDYPNIDKFRGKPIVLAIGRLEERKNTATLVNAFAQISGKNKAGEKPTLVLLGQPGHGAERVFAAVKEARLNGSDIIISHTTTDAEVAAWLSIAHVYAYPSLYEGFGLPILQAFAAKVPVVTTRNSSIPEVAGDAALYVNDPWNEDELAAGINSILYNKEKAHKLIELGNEQLKQFSWEKAAKETLRVLTS